MSGHNKWSKIKHQKAITDAKKGKIFTLLGNAIALASKEGGGNPETNFKLKTAIEKARQENMPMQNIDRSIKRGTGEIKGKVISEITYEAFGPGGTAFIIKTITDNKNRTVNNIRNVLARFNAKLSEGGVKHLFETKGIITVGIKNYELRIKKNDMGLKAIDAGAEDIEEQDDTLLIYTRPQDLFAVKKNLESAGIKTESAELSLEPKISVKIEDEKTAKKIIGLAQTLEENEDISAVYSNFEITEK